MKRTLLVLTMGALLVCPILSQADDAPHPSAPPTGEHHHGPLTRDEMQEVRDAREAALKANPDLAAELKAVQEKIDAAMIVADPKVEPLLAKIKAARESHAEGGSAPAGTN